MKLTYWIAFPKMIGDGSPSAIVDALQYYAAKAVAPRGGVGASRDTSWTAAHTRACVEAGIDVHPWVFSYPHSILGEAKLAKALIDEGATGYIIDAEEPWNHESGKPYWGDTAKRYGSMLREVLGSAPIWDAPWSHITWHPSFPIAAFDTFIDAHLPQFYWTEHGIPLDLCMARCSAQWARTSARPVWPIGVTYGARQLRAVGATPCPGDLVASDVASFVTKYGGRHLYSLEMAIVAGLAPISISAEPARAPTEPLRLPSWDATQSWDVARHRLGI